MERAAGTFQDRLVTELRLACAATIDDANHVLADFLPRFNERFGVPARHTETAYRTLDGQVCLDTTLCLKYRRRVARDNTVKYRWRTLQLLPGMDRPSHAGAVVEVLEGLDGQLAVQHEGSVISSQEAPPRPNILRNFGGKTVHSPVPHLDMNSLGMRWINKLAQLDVKVFQDTADSNGTERIHKATTTRRRKPTPLQTARWKAVQKAKRRGLSIRGIARELGIHRETVRKYMDAESPPMSRRRTPSTVS